VSEKLSFDALLPPEMAVKAEELGVRKARMDAGRLFLLAILAGAFIAIGALFATTVSSAAADAALPYGINRLMAGLAFSVGLILVVVGGAELFTGNALITIAYASRRVTLLQVARNWGIVYLGNLMGAMLTAVLVFLSKQYTFGGGSVGLTVLAIGEAKCALSFIQAVTLGMLCNALVCMAVWMCYSARSTTDRILAIIPPITAFVAAGFEHSIANMYFIPLALFVRDWGDPAFLASIGRTAADLPHLSWGNFLLANLLPVTLGNIIGGGIMVGLVYWFIYNRKAGERSA
jgi:formate transporter FocA